MLTEHVIVQFGERRWALAVNRRPGSGHLLLFLHGLGCVKESFDGAFSAPELADYSLCAVDLLGHGASDKPADFSYSLEDHAKLLEQVITWLRPKQVTIVSHSMGGAIGVLLAPAVPALQRLVNIEGNLVADDCGLASRQLATQTLQEFEQHGLATFTAGLAASDRLDLQLWEQWMRLASPLALHSGARSLVQWSESGKLLAIFTNLHKPVYIYGDEEPKDHLLPLIPEATVRYIPGLMHFMMAENPPLFFAVLAEVL
jgi:pimeloyl-ACP methyl ester carboxylesterase